MKNMVIDDAYEYIFFFSIAINENQIEFMNPECITFAFLKTKNFATWIHVQHV